MAGKTSAGILLYRMKPHGLEVFLVHPGGPYWATRDDGAWSIPKGELDPGDEPLRAAKREFLEETGSAAEGDFRALSPVKQRSGKVVYAWALKGDLDPATVRSNTFSMEWPPHSGVIREFPEVDRGGWFTVAAAMRKLLPGQHSFLIELQSLIAALRH